MLPTKELLLPVERFSPVEEGHFFFGYYDNPAWSGDGEYHLCHKVGFRDRLPGADDVAALGMIRLADRTFVPIAETTAWNFQQGSMLQWHPAAPNEEVIFNRRAEGRFLGVVRNVRSGEERALSRPIAAVSPTGQYALSVNFSRMFDFRPGYGYAGIPDPFDAEDHPPDDGVFLIDLTTGKSELIVSLERIYSARPDGMRDQRLLINHITFNTDGSRFIFLARNNPRDGRRWQTTTFTADLAGRDLYCIREYGYMSHYNWRDPEHVLCYCEAGSRPPALYLLKDRSHDVEAVDPAFFVQDGHCSYSPDRRWVLYDSYPIDGYRYLYLYDLQRRTGTTLGAFYSQPVDIIDIRCDLHPRWNRSGMAISFDSTHEGMRAIYGMDVSSLTGKSL